MDSVLDCKLDSGRNRYVLLKIYVNNDEENGRYIVRGSTLAPDHKTIFEGEEEALKKQGEFKQYAGLFTFWAVCFSTEKLEEHIFVFTVFGSQFSANSIRVEFAKGWSTG